MIYVVMGFHKSGTTLVSKMLHESGIDMGGSFHGSYENCKYEDKRVQQIKRIVLYNGQPRKSYQLPWSYNDATKEIRLYIKQRIKEARGLDWGFKVPDVTLCYEMFKKELPDHVCIGVKRSLEGVIHHYESRFSQTYIQQVIWAWHLYNALMDHYGVKIITFESLLKEGPELLTREFGIKHLKDVRDSREHVV